MFFGLDRYRPALMSGAAGSRRWGCSAAHARGLSWLAAALVLASVSVPAQTYLIDFGGANTTLNGPAPDDPANYWNNLPNATAQTATGAMSNLVSTINTASTIDLVMVRRFNGVNESGTQASTIYPADATRDSMFGNTGNHGGLTDIYPSFKLTDLDPAAKYTLTFYASRMSASDNRETGYTVVGSSTNFVALDAANNVDNTVSVAEVVPDASGAITIDIGPTENNNNSVKYTYLGVLRIDALVPQTPLSFVKQPASQSVVQLKPATFTCEVSGSMPHIYQWYENGIVIPDATQPSYTIPAAELWMNGFTYSVTVSNLLYGVTSTNAVLTVLSDTNPPVALKAASYGGTTVQVQYNEPVEYWTACSTDNYQINAGAVTAVLAELSTDSLTVTLTLSAPLTGAFTVVINNVTDLAGNVVAPNTSLTGDVIPFEDQELLFDFGDGAQTTQLGAAPEHDPENHWNNITGVGTSDSGQLLNALSVHGVPTPVSLVMIRRFSGANNNGTLASTLFPQKATRDSLYGHTELWGELTNIFPSFKLTGLNPARKYTLTIYASRMGVSDVRECLYTVEGATTNLAVLDASNNIDKTVAVEGITPSAAGEIAISMEPTERNNEAHHFTYLGVLRVSPYVAPLKFMQPVVANGKIKLEWTGAAQLQRASSLDGQWTTIEPVPTSPYEEEIVAGASRFYRLKP